MSELMQPRPLALLGLLVSALGVLMLFAFDPATSALFPTCPFHYMTGLHCPGCGTLRALHRLLHFRFAEAFAMNPLTVLCLPFLSYGVASAFFDVTLAKPFPRFHVHPFWWWALLAFIVSFGVARNLPYEPFQSLAPGAYAQ